MIYVSPDTHPGWVIGQIEKEEEEISGEERDIDTT